MKVKPLERVGDSLRVIDQTELPGKLVYRRLDDYQDVIESIRSLRVRGAPAIGIAAAYGLAIAARQATSLDPAYLRTVGDRFKAARPTAVNLSWAVDRVLDSIARAQPGSGPEMVEFLWRQAEAIHDEDRLMCARIGEHGAQLIGDGAVVLTHCNAGALATGGIGTALGVIYTCRDQGKNLRVYADETRPLLQGARLTAWELQQEGIDVTLICDSTAGMLMQQGEIHFVLVGADRIAKNGDTANKIGTYTLAVLAKEHGIPFYVAAPSSTFDPSIDAGDQIIIEERASHEVTRSFGTRTAPEGVSVYSPAFDVTPQRLITGFITDEGVKPGGRAPA
ncbi:MAG TPA: S-methyl-5-thioribose-1-phosphate isomerase [Acidobacteriota bacterium]|nr:S-methyl-5-thioribose-1-phosphate isomerase [Acidobacteriota bacterium]